MLSKASQKIQFKPLRLVSCLHLLSSFKEGYLNITHPFHDKTNECYNIREWCIINVLVKRIKLIDAPYNYSFSAVNIATAFIF